MYQEQAYIPQKPMKKTRDRIFVNKDYHLNPHSSLTMYRHKDEFSNNLNKPIDEYGSHGLCDIPLYSVHVTCTRSSHKLWKDINVRWSLYSVPKNSTEIKKYFFQSKYNSLPLKPLNVSISQWHRMHTSEDFQYLCRYLKYPRQESSLKKNT